MGDLNQAIAGRRWVPLRFDKDGHIQPYDCGAATTIPLEHPVDATPPPAYQVDCRVDATGTIEQEWTAAANTTTVRVPVFQRTTAANLDTPDDPRVLDAPLTVELSTPSGTAGRTVVQPESVSWAPRSVTMRLDRAVVAGEHVTLRLSTAASNGCYGVLVGGRTGDLPDGAYRAVVDGRPRPASQAQLLVRFGAANPH